MNLAFLTLFELTTNNHEIMAEVWDQMRGQGSWNLRFTRDFNDWELDMVVNLLNVLPKEKFISEADKIFWNWETGDSFSIKEAYKAL